MDEENYDEVKDSVLAHIQIVFQELEQEMAMSHQEKYALLEDAFQNAADVNELRVAFEQWFSDQAENLGLEHGIDDLWDHALNKTDE